eukprot:Lankesteria_metandrocarpae@DN6227_c0_g1_i1.p1
MLERNTQISSDGAKSQSDCKEVEGEDSKMLSPLDATQESSTAETSDVHTATQSSVVCSGILTLNTENSNISTRKRVRRNKRVKPPFVTDALHGKYYNLNVERNAGHMIVSTSGDSSSAAVSHHHRNHRRQLPMVHDHRQQQSRYRKTAISGQHHGSKESCRDHRQLDHHHFNHRYPSCVVYDDCYDECEDYYDEDLADEAEYNEADHHLIHDGDRPHTLHSAIDAHTLH